MTRQLVPRVRLTEKSHSTKIQCRI